MPVYVLKALPPVDEDGFVCEHLYVVEIDGEEAAFAAVRKKVGDKCHIAMTDLAVKPEKWAQSKRKVGFVHGPFDVPLPEEMANSIFERIKG